MNKNRSALLLVVVLVAAAGYWLMNRGGNWSPETASPTLTPSSSPAAKAPVKPKASAAPVGPAKSYTELVKEHEGTRIQFDQYCQAIPTRITFKSGSSVMLDNRSGDARYVKVGDESHYLAGYGYKIITMSASPLPKEIWLSCGSAVNVGKVLLQGMLYQ